MECGHISKVIRAIASFKTSSCSLMLHNHQLLLWNAAAAEPNHSQSTLVITHSISCPTVDLSLVLIRTSLGKRAFTFTVWQGESGKLKAIFVSISILYSFYKCLYNQHYIKWIVCYLKFQLISSWSEINILIYS